MEIHNDQIQAGENNSTGPHVPEAGEKARAWEMIENGRYQPRRIKGSCLGRELG